MHHQGANTRGCARAAHMQAPAVPAASPPRASHAARAAWVALLLLALAPAAARAQAAPYPNKPMRMVVTAAVGGITDIMARIMADHVGRATGQTMVVENRPGAGGNIGTAYVAKAAPDGYTLVIVNVGTAAIARWISKDLPFDPINDFVPIAPVAEVPSVMAINDKLPVRTLREFIDYAKANPGKVNYGSAGSGSMPHLAGEVLAHMAAIKLVHVPYKGGGPVAIDLGTGQVQASFLGIGSMQAQLASGTVRALAVAAPQRLAALPSVPTFDEAGLAGYDVTNWFGVLAPKGTPREAVVTMNRLITRMAEDPSVVQRFATSGILPMKESPEAFQQRILADDAKWREVARNAGIKAD